MINGADLSSKMIGYDNQNNSKLYLDNDSSICEDQHELNIKKSNLYKKFDLNFVSMTLVIQSSSTFEKLNEVSRKYCVLRCNIIRRDKFYYSYSYIEYGLKGGINLKRLSILIMSLCLLLVVGCNNESKEEIVEEGKSAPSINLIMMSDSKYFTESEFIDEENRNDGYYKQSYKYEDVKFTLERIKHKEYSYFPVYIEDKEIYDLKYNDKSINDEMGMNLSYPALKATYMTNIDAKEVFNEDILISTDKWDFRLHLEINMNNYDKNSSIIDDIIKNIKIEEVSQEK